MLKPAIIYADELTELFSEHIYDFDYFFFTSAAFDHEIPNFKNEDQAFSYAILDNEENVIGYFSYRIYPYHNTASDFMAYSFDRGNPIIGMELYKTMVSLVKRYHRISWRMISGNPVERSYDKFCERYGGRKVVLHDASRDIDGKYHDIIIYEIIKKN